MSAEVAKEPFELFLQFGRSEFGDRAHVVPKEDVEYQRINLDGGRGSTPTLAWNGKEIKNGLTELQSEKPKKSALVALGDELMRFLRDCRVDAELEHAAEARRPIRITIRSAAAELYALPWELTRLADANKELAQLPDCSIRYTWPTESKRAEVRTEKPRPEGGRILFAWSHGDRDEVPWKSHLAAIESACAMGNGNKQAQSFFDPAIDMVAHATFKEIYRKIEQAAQEGRPYAIVHLLCHGGMLDGNDGVGLVLTDDSTRQRGFSGDRGRIEDIDNLPKETVDPHTLATLLDGAVQDKPRLVVICACLGAAMEAGSHLGSVALELHRTGIESVVASRFLLSKSGSTMLAATLYGALFGRSDAPPVSLESAVQVARAKLRVEHSNTSDYAAIQLFQNAAGWDTRPVVFRPYRGLLTFEIEHRRYFFGRDEEIKETIQDLVNLIQGSRDAHGQLRPRFLIVAAASGTGKSSMVLAGALPRLIENGSFAADAWQKMRPEKDPMAELEAKLKLRKDPSKPFLLIVDQFEEVFTHIDSKEMRTKFVRALWDYARGDSGISVIVTLRVDFFGRCNEIVLDDATGRTLEAVAYKEEHRVFVGRMERTALQEVIEKPAAMVGLGFDDGLVDQMLADAGLEPGALPLLEYTLDQLWEKRERNKDGREILQWKTYQELGRVTGALAKKADAVLKAFNAVRERAAQRLFVQLVDVRDEAGLDTRKRMRRRDLHLGPGVEQAVFEEVLAKLTSERLLTVGKVERSAAKLLDQAPSTSADVVEMDIVEIAHEQLVRSWGKLREWLTADRERILACKPLIERARGSKGLVLHGDELAQARGLREKYPDQLGEDAIALIERSEAKEKQDAEEKRQQQEALKEAYGRTRDYALMAHARELVTGKRKQPNLAASVLAIIDKPERMQGWTELAREIMNIPAPRSTWRYGGMVTAAVWSPDGKYVVTASLDGTAFLRRVDSPDDPVVLRGHKSGLTSAAFSPDGQYVVTASHDHTARLWHVDKPDEPVVLEGHKREVNSVAFSPDGKYVVTASGDATTRLWRVNSPVDPVVLEGHALEVSSAVFSSDGQYVLTASRDKTARLWRVDGLAAPVVLAGHEHEVRSAAISPDGKYVVTTSHDKTARLWDVDRPAEPVVLADREGWVRSAVFSPDGQFIVTASQDGNARLWSVATPAHPVVFAGHEGGIASVAFSLDGKYVVTGSDDKTARLWCIDRLADPLVLEGHENAVHLAAISPDGKYIMTASQDIAVRLWRIDLPADPVVLKGHQSLVRSAAVSPDGAYVVTASNDATARLWRVDSPADPVVLKGHKGSVFSAVFSPDGQYVVTASQDDTARLWRVDGGAEAVVLVGHPIGVTSAVLSHDGQSVVIASQDHTVPLWGVDGTGAPLMVIGHPTGVTVAAFSPDGRYVVTASPDRTARLWRVDRPAVPAVVLGCHDNMVVSAVFSPDGQCVVTTDGRARLWRLDSPSNPLVLEGDAFPVFSAAFSPDGKYIVTASWDRTARLWRVDSPADPVVLKGHEGAVLSAVFSPDGQYVVTASIDHTARLWRVDSPADPVVLKGHQDRVNSAVFSPDSQYVLTASDDNTARLWHVDGSAVPVVLAGHAGGVVSAVFSPYGKYVVTASNDRTARLWRVNTIQAWQEALRNKSTDCLTPEQRERYLLETPEEARKNYEAAERAYGRTPRLPK